MINRIVTRGMGRSTDASGRHRPGMVSQGYGGIFTAIVETAQRIYRTGKSSVRKLEKKVDEVIVYVRLIRVNDEPYEGNVQGSTRISFEVVKKTYVRITESVRVRLRKITDVIRVMATRIRS